MRWWWNNNNHPFSTRVRLRALCSAKLLLALRSSGQRSRMFLPGSVGVTQPAWGLKPQGFNHYRAHWCLHIPATVPPETTFPPVSHAVSVWCCYHLGLTHLTPVLPFVHQRNVCCWFGGVSHIDLTPTSVYGLHCRFYQHLRSDRCMLDCLKTVLWPLLVPFYSFFLIIATSSIWRP